MSDRTLPAEGEVVLAWWGAAVALAYRDGGRWRCFVNKEIIARDMDGWVSLREAKAARAMGEALREVLDNMGCGCCAGKGLDDAMAKADAALDAAGL